MTSNRPGDGCETTVSARGNIGSSDSAWAVGTPVMENHPGVLAVQQHPELHRAYVGIGQMVSQAATDKTFYEDTLAWARGESAVEFHFRDVYRMATSNAFGGSRHLCIVSFGWTVLAMYRTVAE
jgi:hypothetical protein